MIENCIFCEIIYNNAPSYVIYQNKHAIAFLDKFPNTNGHTLIVPKKHFENWSTCSNEALTSVAIATKQVVQILKKTFEPQGFNYISNEGALAYQVVFHYHLHIIPKYKREEGYILKREINRDTLYPLENTYKKILENIK